MDVDSHEQTVIPDTDDPATKPDATETATSTRATVEQSESAPIRKDKAATPANLPTLAHPARAGAKRKFGDQENDGFTVLKQTDKPTKASNVADKARTLQDLHKRKSVKDPATGKRDVRDRSVAADAQVFNPRKALSAKSTNDSPRKVTQPTAFDISKPLTKPSALESAKKTHPADAAAEKRISRAPKKSLAIVQIPPPQDQPSAPASTITIPEPETPLPELDLVTPNTPEPRSAPTSRDTPPPGMGEAARPSRRARPAISYAEPNLRDKMRRPTKELFDAVAGEGKFKARTSIAAPGTAQKAADQIGSAARAASSTKGKENGQPEEGMSAVEMAVAKEASRRESALSPTPGAHQKDVYDLHAGDEELPNTITTQRRKRGSSMGVSSTDSLATGNTMTGTLNFEPKQSNAAPAAEDGNVYDFESSSPLPEEKKEEPEPPIVRTQPRKSRASASFQGTGSGSLTSESAAGKYAGKGKRASMAAAMTKLSKLELEDTEESSLEGEIVVRDRISRRKSMML
jgi:hypothetical protein